MADPDALPHSARGGYPAATVTSRRLSALIFLFALAVHGLLIALSHWPSPRRPIGDEPSYLATASAIATDQLAEQEGQPVEHDMLWPPLYPRFLAFCGVGTERGWGRLQLIQFLLLAAVGWMLRDLTLRLLSERASPPVARLAADLVAATTVAFPPLASYAQFFFPEILHLALWTSLVWMIARRAPAAAPAPRHGWSGWPPSLLFGLALGSALLTKSLLQPFAPLLLLAWAVVTYRRYPTHRLRHALTAGGLAALIAAATLWPTLATNHRRHGLWAVANSGPINLWIGLNDTARRDRVESVVRQEIQRYRKAGDSPRAQQEWAEEQIRGYIAKRGLGPILREQLGRQYFRLLGKDSFFTDQLPGGILHQRKRGYRGTPTLVANALRGASWGLYAMLLPLIAFGLVLEPPRGRSWVWVVASFLLYSLVLFLVVHVKSRYRVQLLPLLFPFAGAALAHALARAPGLGQRLGLAPTGASQPPPMPRWRMTLASTVAALLLFLAFGGEWLDRLGG